MKKVLRNLTMAYYAVFIGAIASALLGFYVLKSGITIDPLSSTGIALQSVLIVLIIGSVPVSLFIFNRSAKKWAQLTDTAQKLTKYQRGSYIRLAIIGAGLVLGVLFYYIMQNQSMIFCAGIAAIGLFFCKPAEVKIITELNLEETEN